MVRPLTQEQQEFLDRAWAEVEAQGSDSQQALIRGVALAMIESDEPPEGALCST